MAPLYKGERFETRRCRRHETRRPHRQRPDGSARRRLDRARDGSAGCDVRRAFGQAGRRQAGCGGITLEQRPQASSGEEIENRKTCEASGVGHSRGNSREEGETCEEEGRKEAALTT